MGVSLFVGYLPRFADVLLITALQKDIALVNENYPPECITYGSLLDPSYPRFKVVGTPVPAKGEPAPAIEQMTADLLPLKRPRREKEMSPERLQSPPKEHVSAGPPIPEPVDETSEPPQDAEIETEPRERDALDDIINESKATSHLVRIISSNKHLRLRLLLTFTLATRLGRGVSSRNI